jgi:hypothetical protein
MNLLDFGDDDSATPAAPASSDPMALLDQLSAPAVPPKVAVAAVDNDDWADFTSTEPAALGTAATSGANTTDWAPFPSGAQPRTVDKGDDWADFASAPGVGTSSAGFADPFNMPASQRAAAAAPTGFVGTVPSTGVRQALPLDAFVAPVVEPIPVPSSAAVGHPAESRAPASVPAAVKAAPEKDPFADLLG